MGGRFTNFESQESKERFLPTLQSSSDTVHVLLGVDAKDVESETHVAESSDKKLNSSSSKANPLNMSSSRTAVILFTVCNYRNV
jgi:hypothetical protein